MKKQVVISALLLGFSIIILVVAAELRNIQTLGLGQDEAEMLQYSGQNVIILKPRFTEAAYGYGGFYDYYEGRCGTKCLNITLQPGNILRWGAFNIKSIFVLEKHGWPTMNDTDAHVRLLEDPSFLGRYDSVILLHNEYVTRELYTAITSHKNVIYLMPNALYAEIRYNDGYVSLVRGHNYPEPDIRNGFAWKHDNSVEEYDTDCESWHFRRVSNGHQLSCYPEKTILDKPEIIAKMKQLL